VSSGWCIVSEIDTGSKSKMAVAAILDFIFNGYNSVVMVYIGTTLHVET